MELGKAIKYYRNKSKLTQKELAKKVNVSERTIGHYETETRVPSLDVLNLIAQALHTKVSTFLEPIPKERKEILYEKTWLLVLDEKIGFQLSEPPAGSKQGDFCSLRIKNELIYIPTLFIERIISSEEPNLEKLDFEKEAQELWYVVLVDSRKKEKKRYTLQVDEVREITHYLATHDEVNRFYEEQKQKEKLIKRISLSALSLSVDAARINSTALYDFAHHIKALGTILKENHSKKILETKLEEIYDTYKEITEEEKQKMKSFHKQTLEESKIINKDVDEKDLFVPKLKDVMDLVKQAEGKK